MAKWNGDVLGINETVQKLGPRKCNLLLGVHAILGSNTVSYPFGKGKFSAPKLQDIDLPGLHGVLGQPAASSAELKATGVSFFCQCTDRRGAQQ